jgi:hypothetical protein
MSTTIRIADREFRSRGDHIHDYSLWIYPRCALEFADTGYGRLNKIIDLIGFCDFSLHDISRTELDAPEPYTDPVSCELVT